MNLLLGVLFLALSAVLLSLAIGVFRFFWKRDRVRKITSGMNSGIYVEHGMVVDPDTGMVSSQKKTSRQAYTHL